MPKREGHDEVIFPSGIPAVVDAIRDVFHAHPEYRDTREYADGGAFETNIEIPWSLIKMPLTVTVIAEQGQTRVSATVRSRWWAQIDPYGSRDTSIRKFFKALREKINARP